MTTATVEHPAAGWTADDSTFGARLALIRQRMGWGNVEKAARACGLPVETWRSWERDNREPMRRTVIGKQIASATGCDYLWLVHGPDRGGAQPTAQYLPGERLIATIGDSALDVRPTPRRRTAHRARPITEGSIRPLTPVGR